MSEPSPTTLVVETTASEECPVDFLGESSDIVYFLSFAHSERYGADHPLARAAGIIKRRFKIDISPLLTFADARTEGDAEERALEAMWREPKPLAASARGVAEALEATPQLKELTSDFPELPHRLRELGEMADWAAERGAKIRLTYVI